MVAFGEFSANDLMENSVKPDDFILLESASNGISGKDIKKVAQENSKNALD